MSQLTLISLSYIRMSQHTRFRYLSHIHEVPGHIGQSVMCLTADTCLTPDPGATSSILARSHTLAEIDHEIVSTAILLPSTDSRRLVVSCKRKYVHEVLVNWLIKLAQEKSVIR